MPQNRYEYDQHEVNEHVMKAITDISNALEEMQKLILNIIGLIDMDLHESLVSPTGSAANEEE